MHFIFVYFVRGGFRPKIECVLNIQSKAGKPQRLAAARKFHVYDMSEVTRIRKLSAYEIFWSTVSASWRMQVEKIDEAISVTATDYLCQHCACKRSLRTEMKLSFRAFRVERQRWASLSSWEKTLYFPRPRKYRLDYFPRHIDLGCASVNM